MLAYTYRSTQSAWRLYRGTYYCGMVYYTVRVRDIVKTRCEFEGIAR